MSTIFAIATDNNITAFTAAEQISEGQDRFATEKEFARLSADWPIARFAEVWNTFAGVVPFGDLKPVKKFTDRKTAVARIWKAIQALTPAPAPQAAPVAPKKAKATKQAKAKDATPTARDGRLAVRELLDLLQVAEGDYSREGIPDLGEAGDGPVGGEFGELLLGGETVLAFGNLLGGGEGGNVVVGGDCECGHGCSPVSKLDFVDDPARLVGADSVCGRHLRAKAGGSPDADLATSGEVGAEPAAAWVFAGEADSGQRAADLHDVGRSDVYVLLLHG